MTLTITPEVEVLLQREMKSGRFRDTNEVIAAALETLAWVLAMLIWRRNDFSQRFSGWSMDGL